MYKLLVLLTVLVVVVAVPLEHSPLWLIYSGRIVGGKETTIENAPHQVSIHLEGGLYCGGSIISKEWIVTAAHCSEYSHKYYKIRAGSAYHSSGGSVHNVAEIIRHENYNIDLNLPVNDIALMRVDVPFKFDQTRAPIPLFEQFEHAKEGAMSVVSGWGYTQHNFPNTLHVVEVPIVSKAECNKNYAEIGGLPEKQICAAYPTGGKDACSGDSGGPLAIDGRLAGITSWGLGCAQAGYPGVYTEVASYRTWIKNMIGI